ncbi:MAG: RsmE family RNA methyltransferase [Chlamydiales bacterium]|nr:RsmE family RNA methyltransferase [Chlamydiales bacterium]
MPHERFFYPHEMQEGDIISLPPEEEKHMSVMRIRPGDSVELVNGCGFLGAATLLSSSKKNISLKITKVDFEKESSPKLIIAQSLPRANRLDFILEKGTELGMHELWLFPGEFSEKKEIGENLLQRMKSITIAALKQCGRLYLPNIRIMPSLSSWDVSELPSSLFFGDTSKDAKPFINYWKDYNDLIFFVGPEKGFSANEIECLLKMHAKGVKLHESILRTDTASLAFLSIAKHVLLGKTYV